MSQQIINIGATPGDNTGDQARLAFDKCNQNFTELYTKGAGTSTEGIWNFNQTSTDTTTSPTTGRFRTNTGDFATATQLAIHQDTIDGIDRSNVIRAQLVGDVIQCQDPGNADSWCRYRITATPVDNSTWFQINISFQGGGGTAPGNNREILFTFTAGGGGGGGTITLSGDVTGSGTTAITTTIANNAVTTAKLADMATATIRGRVASGTGDPQDLTGTQATTLLDVFTSTLKGLAPPSGGGTANFLRADATWAAPVGGGGRLGGILVYSSTTALTFKPYNGNQIQINTTQYTIPNAGIAGLANTSVFVNGTSGQNLAASTTYYVYAFINAATVTADFRTDGNGHITDTTTSNEGVEVRSSSGTTPDPTRTLIGLIRTNASSQFQDDAGNRWVRTWFNRRVLPFFGAFLASDTLTSGQTAGSFSEFSSTIRVNFLIWSGETLFAVVCGGSYAGGSAFSIVSCSFDGTTSNGGRSLINTSGTLQALAATVSRNDLIEGAQFVTVGGTPGAGAGTAFFLAGNSRLQGTLGA